MTGERLFPGEGISLSRLRARQFEALNRALRYAAGQSPFYRRKLAGISLPLRRLKDLAGLPFTSAREIGNMLDMVCLPAERVERIVTLQSTGTDDAKRVCFSRRDLEQTVRFFETGMNYMTGPYDRVAIHLPVRAQYSVGRLLADGLRRMGAQPFLLDVIRDYEAAVANLAAIDPHTVVGMPAQIRKLALLAPQARPKNVLLSADYVPESVRRTIERTWKCPVFTHYGLTESGYGCAVECPCHTGHHLRHDDLLVEIVRPGGEGVLPPRAWGEIVLTTLDREAMPLIRYRTGDMGRLLDGPCGCGSLLPRLDHVRGRLSELSRPVPIYRLDELLLGIDGVLDYSAALEGQTLEIEAECGDQAAAKECRALAQAAWPKLRVRVLPVSGLRPQPYPQRRILRQVSE